MTSEQEVAVTELRRQFDEAGWEVTIDDSHGEIVTLSAYGGPRAFRAYTITPHGTVTTQAFA